MKRTLISLCGRTPQIITESLYALHMQGRFPTRVVVLTTERGREACLAQLLPAGRGRLAALLAALGRAEDSLTFSETDILTPSARSGGPVPDIETEEDSRLFFELCLETVFTLSRSRNGELLFSIAGGRKTMSAALALAAQCYARPQDSMFHVLVPPEKESDPQFFHPVAPMEDTCITLTPIPFFRMRNHLPPELLHSPATLETLSHICTPQPPLSLTLDMKKRLLCCEGRTLSLPPALFAVYAFFALEKALCPDSAALCPMECRACSLTWADVEAKRDDILLIYRCVETKNLARGQYGILHLSAANFRSTLAKLKKLLIQNFGENTGARLGIISERKNGAATYALRIPQKQIIIKNTI